MHFDVEQVLWALVLAAHLILLIVLLGRDRISRFPWFTAAIAVSAVRLIADHLLHDKLTSIAFYWQSYSSMLLSVLLGLMVLAELSRQVFSSRRAGRVLKANGWMGWGLIVVAISAAAVWLWGPWPSWQALHSQPAQLPLLIVLLSALKGELFVAILTIEIVVLMQIFGKRFGSGWRSHAQQIGLGLSTNAIGFLALQAITETMQRHVHFTTPQERQQVAQRLSHLFNNLDHSRFALWLLVLLWWIFWLWRDEQVARTGQDHGPASDEEPSESAESVEQTASAPLQTSQNDREAAADPQI